VVPGVSHLQARRDAVVGIGGVPPQAAPEQHAATLVVLRLAHEEVEAEDDLPQPLHHLCWQLQVLGWLPVSFRGIPALCMACARVID
jgi:hypothetical protein